MSSPCRKGGRRKKCPALLDHFMPPRTGATLINQ
jgi:hypothetical protein